MKCSRRFYIHESLTLNLELYTHVKTVIGDTNFGWTRVFVPFHFFASYRGSQGLRGSPGTPDNLRNKILVKYKKNLFIEC